jgi:hypothetical protein
MAEHDADRTAKWHRGLVRSFMGTHTIRRFSSQDRIRLLTDPGPNVIGVPADLVLGHRLGLGAQSIDQN